MVFSCLHEFRSFNSLLSLLQIPDEVPSIAIAHEYLDALPVHQFVKDEKRGWLEVLVDEAQSPGDPRVRTCQHTCMTHTARDLLDPVCSRVVAVVMCC